MPKSYFAAFLLSAGLVSPLTAHAEDQYSYGGNEMLQLCDTIPAAAVGYAVGAIDAATTLARWRDQPLTICVPEGTQDRQKMDVMCQYLRNNPAERHLSASSLALYAFGEVWPCDNRS